MSSGLYFGHRTPVQIWARTTPLRKTLALFCLSCGVCVTVAWAAQDTAPATSSPSSASKAADNQADASTSIDLIARDRKGRPVTDLKPEELAVTDDGASVKIDSLRLVNGAQSSERMVALVFGQLDPAAMKNSRAVAHKSLTM